MKDFFQLISAEDFLALFSNFSPLEAETVPLPQALGRVPAGPLPKAPEDLPPFARSTMDGFAVRARDTFGCSESEPVPLTIQGEVRMGEDPAGLNLKPGQCARIWTGGVLPPGSDAVLMIEYSRLLDERTVEIFRPVAPMENVIRAGEDYRQNSPILTDRQPLRPQDLGVLAGLGLTEVHVHRRPRVGIISTGDELVPPDRQPAPGQIRDINSTTLASLARQAGAEATTYGIIADDLALMRERCQSALADNDILLLSGGSSVGRRDFTLQVLEQLPDSRLLAHGVAIRPGKPTLLAARGNQAVFGLPGHVASAMVVFLLFVRPLIRLFSGLDAGHGLLTVTTRAAQPIPSAIGREEYVRVRLEPSADGLTTPLAHPVFGKSGLLSPLVRAHGLLVIGRDVEGLDRGAAAPVLLFPSESAAPWSAGATTHENHGVGSGDRRI